MKILIGYDGSESAGEVFTDLKTAGLPSDTESIVATVGELLIIPPSDKEEYESVIPSKRVASAIRKMDEHVENVIKESPAALKLLKNAESIDPGAQARLYS